MDAPLDLRVEHLGRAVLGLGDRRPRLSWRLPAGATRQDAYRLQVDDQVLGRVPSGECVLRPWPGEALHSAQRVEWRVQVSTDLGASAWSEPAWFETGLLEPADWVARWIEPEVAGAAHVLRQRFDSASSPAGGRLYITAHGIYEAFLNGQRVGDTELAPGWTSYPTTLHVQVYDVSDLLRDGPNVIEVVLSDGWFRGRTRAQQHRNGYGETLALLAQLRVGDFVLGTGPDWEAALGTLVSADLMAGQTEDRRRRPTTWSPVRVADFGLSNLAYSPAPPTRRTQEIRPEAITRPKPDRLVVDLGQNISGWVRLTDLGPAGTELTLTHGEALDADGDVTTDHLAAEEYETNQPVPVGQIDRVISAGTEGDLFEPRHTTHGFQYVRVEGHPGRLTPDDVTGVVVHTDMRRTGWFRCSDERLNRLHEVTDWSFRGNACEIPTDCPHRERVGWTGDWQTFFPAAAFLYDVAGFSVKWLRGLASEQLPDGCVINHPPDPFRYSRPPGFRSDIWPFLQGSSGWGDAAVIVPWGVWTAYGDAGLLAEMWPTMVGWVDFAADAARTRRFAGRQQERPEPAPHEQFLWDGGFHWGEWLEPGREHTEFWTVDPGSIGTAFLHHSAKLLSRIGLLLGNEGEAARFGELADHAREAWRTEYIGPDGALSPDTQANHVRALAFDLVPPELRAQTAARLVALIREADTHLATGFLSTPYLLPVLAANGYLEVAYEVLLQDTPPSWLTMVERGATTLWEHWEGIDSNGVPRASLNHYSRGAVVTFLHRFVAGLQPLEDFPAYRHFRVEPHPGGNLSWAEAVHDSRYGRIESAWRREGHAMRLTVTVPSGTSAEVVLPDGTTYNAIAGTTTLACDVPRG